MDYLVMAGQLLLALSILIILHEGGHAVAARSFGMRVEKFYLFFDAWDKKLFNFKRGETEYGIGWLPLGGYVKISGMIDESMDKEAMAEEPKTWEFRSKPAWQRLIVMLGGVTVNALLGMLIFSLALFHYGDKWLPADQLKNGIVALELGKDIGLISGDKILAINGKKVERVSDYFAPNTYLEDNVVLNIEREGQLMDIPVPDDFIVRLSAESDKGFIGIRYTFFVEKTQSGGNAEQAGIVKDDVIISLNGTEIAFFDEFQALLKDHSGDEVELGVLRNGSKLKMKAQIGDDGKLGFEVGSSDFKKETEYFGIVESFKKGSVKAWAMLGLQIKGIGKMMRSDASIGDSVMGPLGIAAAFGGVWDWERFWALTGILSMILAFMNLLPIPALDGGHVLFLSIEALTGKTLNDKVMERIQIVGMIFLLSLMVLIIGNDLRKGIMSLLAG